MKILITNTHSLGQKKKMCQAWQHVNTRDDIVVLFGQVAVRGLKICITSALASGQIGHVYMKLSTSSYFTLARK